MWSLGRQMRQLYSARLAIEKGKGAPYVAGLWGLKPYPADKLMTSARRFSLSWCRRAVVRCGQTDLAMKSTGQDAQELADRPAAGAGGSVTAGGAAGGPGLRTVRRRMRGGEEIASHPGGCRGGGPV